MTDETNQQYMNLLNSQVQPFIERYASVIKELTDPSYLLPIIEANLKRQEFKVDEKGEYHLIQKAGASPLLNAEGVDNILAIVSTVINNNPVLNSLSENAINNMIHQVYTSIIMDLAVSRKRYNIYNSKDRDLIVNLAVIPTYITLLRGLDGGERKFLTSKPGIAEQGSQRSIFNPFARGK